MTTEEFKIQYLSLHKRLYAFALKSLGNTEDAEDAVQTLYLKLWERRLQLDEVQDRWNYCAKALANICHDKKRVTSKEIAEELNENIPDTANDNFETSDFEKFVQHFVTRLPDKQQTVMSMRMQGATTEEIVNATDLSATNVRTILSRVRQELRKFYK